MTIEEFVDSTVQHDQPPAEWTAELRSLWYMKADQWEAAHNIAQDIPTPLGSWLHALLHLVEGDTGNAGYWFRKAGKPVRSTGEIDALWMEIAQELLA